MALQTVIDREEGAIDAMAQRITVYDDGGAAVSVADAVTEAQSIAPANFFGVGQDTVPNVRRISPYAVEVGVNYRYRRLTSLKRPTPPEAGSVTRYVPPMFTKPRTLHAFLSAGSVYGPSGDVTTEPKYEHLKWPIDLPGGPGFLLTTPGHIFEPQHVTRGFRFVLTNANVTDSYLDAIESLISRGCWNDATFMGRPTGTVQFVSFSANERSADDWDLDFGFGYQPKREGVQLAGDIELPEVYGYQYYYERLLPTPVIQADKIIAVIQKPDVAIIGSVWELDDFSQLNLS